MLLPDTQCAVADMLDIHLVSEKKLVHIVRILLCNFRIHQFEKVEQFCIAAQMVNESWEMYKEMIRNSEDFYSEVYPKLATNMLFCLT